MRWIVCLLVIAAAAVVNADTVVVRRPVAVVTAQDHAVVIARRGSLIHSSCGQTEGIGCGSTPEKARKNRFFGQRQIAEEGVAFSPVTRRWYAVIRYR